MFYLRKITPSGTEMNFTLGSSYNVIHQERNKESFVKIMKEVAHAHPDKTFAVITNHDGSEYFDLYIGHDNYIMTGDGKTFSTISQ